MKSPGVFVAVTVLLWCVFALVALLAAGGMLDGWALLNAALNNVFHASGDEHNELSPAAALDWHILQHIRWPRVVLASLVGACLGCAGAAMQGLLRNPLAEPGIIGVSAGAALAAVLVLYFGLVGFHSALLPLSAVLGSCVALPLVLLVAGTAPPVTTLILAGVAVSAALGGGIALALNFAPNPFAMQEISFWLMGSVAHRDLAQVSMILPFVLLGFACLLLSAKFLRALSLGESTARSLGFGLLKGRLLVLFGVALLTGAAVAVAGIVGFVGLMVPHAVRLLLGPDPGRLLWTSALLGAVFVLFIDLCVQWLSPASELKLGVLMSLIGAPFFLMLLHRSKTVTGL